MAISNVYKANATLLERNTCIAQRTTQVTSVNSKRRVTCKCTSRNRRVHNLPARVLCQQNESDHLYRKNKIRHDMKRRSTASLDKGQTKTRHPSDWRDKSKHWIVWKFGGTCVAGPERLKQVADLIQKEIEKGNRLAVVLSAMGSSPESPVKITDQLLKTVSDAVGKTSLFKEGLQNIEELHILAAKELIGADSGVLYEEFVSELQADIKNLKAMLGAIKIVGVSSQSFSDFVVGHGELWNARLLTAYLKKIGISSAGMVDARDVLVVEPSEQGTVDVDYTISREKLDAYHASRSDGGEPMMPLVITGFIAQTMDGVATTLRRNGSDYSGTIMAALLNAQSITIWTDVDGVFTADPRKVAEAEPLSHLSYNEAWELSYFGANVLHPRSTLPAMKYGIPIYIKNFFNLDAYGTKIDNREVAFEQKDALIRGEKWRNVVKGFATIDHCCMINIEGTGMIGVPGTASRIFACIRDAGINVIMISQGSSEHSVCFAIENRYARNARDALKAEFQEYLDSGLLDNILVIENCTILAAVGSKLAHAVGASAHMFGALAQAGVNIRATAQGCSEHNITVVIDSDDSARALEAVHSAFYLSDTAVSVGLVGPGLVGKTLLEQFSTQLETLKMDSHIDMRIFGIASSKKMLISDVAIDLHNWEEEFEKHAIPCDLSAFKDHIVSRSMAKSVIVDCTASDAVPEYYEEWMTSGVSVVTPNKKLNSGPYDRYKVVKSLQEKNHVHYFYEATVGAGLPVLATIKYLLDTGDKIKRIEGVFSGTLSYIFNKLEEGVNFSDIVKEAKENGFTEPDPRDDLSGTDVARKVTTLARECGLSLELPDIPVQSLVPEELESCSSSEAFMSALPDYDNLISDKQIEAQKNGEVLRYVGVVDVETGKGSVELRTYPTTHPFAQLNGTDNIILCVSDRYDPQPLVITGPGAGAEVTAGGVFSDLIRLCAHFGAPS